MKLGAVPGTQGSLSCLVQRLAPYNQAIRSAVAQADCQLVDLAAMHSRYDALDAFHPNGTAGQALAPRNGSFLIGQKLFLILYSFFHFSLR